MAQEGTQTNDNKTIIKPYGLKEIDIGFYKWWNEVLNLHFKDKDGQSKKVPVQFITSERWFRARADGMRDVDGKIIVPAITVARTEEFDMADGPTSRVFADIQEPHVIAREADIKSSIVKNALEARDFTFEENHPIYEIYTVPVRDHFSLKYEVGIWAPYVQDMNSFIEKIGMQMNFKSKKMFVFHIDNGMYFVAHKQDEIVDDSNVEDFSAVERMIKKEFTFMVSAHILPESDERKDAFRRYFSQSRITFGTETTIDDEEFAKLIKESKRR